MRDVAVVGAGPAGLGAAIALRLRGLDVVVFERAVGEIDKACGEGVMPAGVAALESMGVLAHLDGSRATSVPGICYVNEDGSRACGRLPFAAMGIRRIALSRALRTRAREVGVELHEGTPAEWAGRDAAGRPRLQVGGAIVDAAFLIAADGLHSRFAACLNLAPDVSAGERRFGMRRHFRIAPWTDFVEVYFVPGVEAYVTPVGAHELGIAFLWGEDGAERADFDTFLARFPLLAERVSGAPFSSDLRGAGALRRRVPVIVAENVALVGDAAGYVDAITGEGISLALETAAVLAEEVARKRAGVMSEYARAHRRAFREYALLADALLLIAQRPRLRRAAIRTLGSVPLLFDVALRTLLGAARPERGRRHLPPLAMTPSLH